MRRIQSVIIGVGTDIIEIKRIEKALKTNPRFKEKLFTESERLYFNKIHNREESIAGSFAAKEAVSKALGTGFRAFEMKDIEIKRNELGKPYVELQGVAKQLGEKLGLEHIQLSISHCKEYAVAFVVIEGKGIGEVNN